MVYPKQKENILGMESIAPKKVIFDGKELDQLKVIPLRYDEYVPYEYIGLCIDDRYPDINNRIFETTFASVFEKSPIGFKDNKNDKLLNIRIGEFEGNTVYKIPFGSAFSNFICALIVGNKIRFYSPYETSDCRYGKYISEMFYSPTYKCISKDKFISKKTAADFVKKLLEQYEIDTEEEFDETKIDLPEELKKLS